MYGTLNVYESEEKFLVCCGTGGMCNATTGKPATPEKSRFVETDWLCAYRLNLFVAKGIEDCRWQPVNVATVTDLDVTKEVIRKGRRTWRRKAPSGPPTVGGRVGIGHRPSGKKRGPLGTAKGRWLTSHVTRKGGGKHTTEIMKRKERMSSIPKKKKGKAKYATKKKRPVSVRPPAAQTPSTLRRPRGKRKKGGYGKGSGGI